MKKLWNKIKKAIAAFRFSWRNDISVEEMRVNSIVESISGLQEQLMRQQEMDQVAAQVSAQYGKMINDYFMKTLDRILPEPIKSLYIEDRNKIPGLDMFIHKFTDLSTRTYGNDVKILFMKRVVGHIVITSKLENESIKIDLKEFPVEDKKGEPAR